MFKYSIIILIFNFVLISTLKAQSVFNQNFSKKILSEYSLFNSKSDSSNQKSDFNIYLNQSFYNNTNLPNLENQNGLYFPKGFGNYSGILFTYQNRLIEFSIEPLLFIQRKYPLVIPQKSDAFSVLNDTPIASYNPFMFKNLGVKIKYNGIMISYGNWNRWWGPGIHNSLSMTNNTNGFFNYSISTDGFRKITENIDYKLEYYISNSMKNIFNEKFYLSSINFTLKYNQIKIGLSKNVLSGGYSEIDWDSKDASIVIFTNDKSLLWNSTIDLFINYTSNNGLIAFLEIGIPNRTFSNKNYNAYRDHSMASILGLRKYNILNIKELFFGFEYARLVQSRYYNMLPSPNWYDDIKYNYSSYNQRRWAAHIGSDSDDLLLYLGYLINNLSIIYGINYERHGITFNYPPEVKLETRISLSYKLKNIFMVLNYEDEFFKHYGFVDRNNNVWNEIYEKDSIQRSKTILFSLEYSIF